MEIEVTSNCAECFGLCCVALPFAKSADFGFDKQSGAPCPNLQEDFSCGIHRKLRSEGFSGCTVYECFGAGQHVAQGTYEGKDWRRFPELAEEMFAVFPVMQELHEMLYYLAEASLKSEIASMHALINRMYKETEALTDESPQVLLSLNVDAHRARVNEVLVKTSEMFRANAPRKRRQKGSSDYVGARLRKADFKGADARGALFIAADLREADFSYADVIGADFRDADVRGTNLRKTLFLTQAQVNAAKGNKHTLMPSNLNYPIHWT
ncbi:pentapeptide repeat-containing protein [Aureibacillus halotolerans]|uniref:Uncharacterized protein YjbI with pentapeptide repeats n=1 Tax=Aureibacillus halotolerans TaxID=1508390 RepID=A0A4R6TWK8_9BACI|nr:pentapeptide repeat-containing protein [Aureibacillus halotolerans]TDQ36225.1 uncharacterized protein YjbI with pentapeptide repeats [Aureibacillus halotolerans]